MTFDCQGNRTDLNEDPEFGEKFLGVALNGTLEIHGPEKLSFTRLAKPLVPKEKDYYEMRR